MIFPILSLNVFAFPSQQFYVIVTYLLRKWLRNIYIIWKLEWKHFLHNFPNVNIT